MEGVRRIVAALVVLLLAMVSGPLVGRADAVVNGVPVTPERYESDWPWSVALRVVATDGTTLLASCSGSLIAPAWVLTAAHCVDGYLDEGSDVRVVHGAPDVNDGEVFEVDEMSRDPLYNPNADTGAHDVGLLHLTADPGGPYAPLAIDSTIPSELHAGMPLEIAGWGISAPAVSLDLEREGPMTLVTVGVGQLLASPAPAVSCSGDSGGPVVADLDDGRRALVGVTSRGDTACAEYAAEADVRTSAAFITAHVGALPDATPVVTDETLSGLVEDGPGGAMDVLTNDTDPDGDVLSVVAAQPSNGTGSCTPTGVCSFTPDPDVNSGDGAPVGVFYVVHDGRGRLVTGFLSADVAPQPDPPEVTLIDGATSGEAPFDATIYVASTDVDGTTIGGMAITADYGDGSPPEPVTVLGFIDTGPVAIAPHRYLEPGTFTVAITIEDPDGLTASGATTVTVTPGPPQLTVADVDVGEAGGTATLHAHLSAAAADPVDVSFLSNEGSAGRDDFDVTDGVLRFNPGVTDIAVPIGITKDRRAEADESFDVSFTVTSGPAVAVDPVAAVTIHDDDAPVPPRDGPPVLTPAFEMYDYEVPLGPGETSVEIALPDPVSANDETGPLPVTCNHATAPGVFPLGTTIVKCSATDPTGHARSTTFKVVLRATGDDFGDFDENLPPTIRVANVSALEEAGVVTVPITMSGPSTLMQFVRVDVTSSARDVVRTRVVRTLLPGETADSFDVVLRNDSVAELDVIPLVATGFDAQAVSGSLTITDSDVDTRAPVLVTHAERFLALLPSSVPRPVALDYGVVSALDEADGALPTLCTPAAGALFPKGTTQVSCRATDHAGLVGRLRFPVVVRQV